MADAKIDPTKEIEENVEEREEIELPNFIDESEKIPYDDQSLIAEYKRLTNTDQSSETLLTGIGEESGLWDFSGKAVRFLKLRLSNRVAVYVPQNEIGAQWQHMDILVGKEFKLAIVDFMATDTYDDEGHPEYVVLGSMKQAEYIVSKELMNEYEKAEKEKETSFTSKRRHGVITDVIDTPELQIIFFNYRGISLAMYENDFVYSTYLQPLNKIAHIGDHISFQITSIEKTRYEDLDITMAKSTNDNAPKGERYFIRTTSLPYREDPIKRVERLQKSGGTCIAHIWKYNPIVGILVEIAPGWHIKAILSNHSPYKPSINDEIAHTPVSIRIESLDKKNRMGVCRILAFPQGVARSGIQKF